MYRGWTGYVNLKSGIACPTNLVTLLNEFGESSVSVFFFILLILII